MKLWEYYVTIKEVRKARRMKFLSLKEVAECTGLSRTTIWRMQRAKKFPQQVQLSERRVGIPDNEISEWINSRKNVDGSQHFSSSP